MEEKPQTPSSVYEDEDLYSKWSYNANSASDRRKLYNILFKASSFADYVDTLNTVSDKDKFPRLHFQTPPRPLPMEGGEPPSWSRLVTMALEHYQTLTRPVFFSRLDQIDVSLRKV